jgi:transmembrane sensor
MTTPEPAPPLGKHLADALSESELSSTWQRVQVTRDSKMRRRSRHRAGVAMLAACAVAAAVGGLWFRPTGELLLQNGEALHRLEGNQTAQLSDDSRIRTTAEGELEVLENSQARFSLHLVRGAARFEVTPGTGRQWRVETGQVSVEVVGTIFVVARDEANVRVAVERGVVVVRGARVPDGVRRLAAGEHLEVGPPKDAPGPQAAEALPSPPRIKPRTSSTQPPAIAPARPQSVESPASLLSAADLARLEEKPEQAVSMLRALVERWPESAEAPLAAFTAANLLVEAGQIDAAHDWYQRALELRLEEPLAEAARRALDAGHRP